MVSVFVEAPWLAVLLLLVIGCQPGPKPDRGADPDDDRRACLENPTQEAACRRWALAEIATHHDDALAMELQALHAQAPRAWVPLYLLGEIPFRRGRATEARPMYEECLAVARNAGAPRGQARCLNRLGWIAYLGGQPTEATSLLDEALEAAEAEGDPALSAVTLNNIAGIERSAGHFIKARSTMLHVVGILETRGNSEFLRGALYNLGELERQLGRPADAEPLFRRVLRLAEQAEDPLSKADSSTGLGLAALDRAEPGDAEVFFAVAERSARAAGEESLAIQAAILLAVAQMRNGKPRRALQALEVIEADKPELSEVLRLRLWLYLADAARRSGEVERAQEAFSRAATIEQRLGMPVERWEIHAGRALLLRSTGRLDESIAEARAAVTVIEGLRGWVPATAERTHFMNARIEAYEILAAALAERSLASTGEIYALLEAAHGRTLRETLLQEKDTASLRDVSLPSLQARLLPGDLLLEYLLGEQDSVLLAVTQKSAEIHLLPSRRLVEEQIGRYRQVLLRPATSRNARRDPEGDFRRFGDLGHDLFETLVGPAGDALETARRLLIVPDRRLYLLPFEALPVEPVSSEDPLRFLGFELPVTYLPASALLGGDPSGLQSRGQVVVVAGGGGAPDHGLPPLRSAGREISAVTDAYGPSRVTVVGGADAIREHLLQAGADVTTLHVVAHALFDSIDGPEIVVGEDEGRLLTLGARDLQASGHSPPLVILSACNTARGEVVGGEGTLGLVREFALSGSRYVVASTWNVEDVDAALLMSRFHSRLAKGADPVQALFEARRQKAQRFSHPYSWAALSIHGPLAVR